MFEHTALIPAISLTTDQGQLRLWGLRLGERVHGALGLGSDLDRFAADLRANLDVIRHFLVGQRQPSLLDIPATRWLRLTETQISRNLAAFLTSGGPPRVLAFLRALPCAGVNLPASLVMTRARAEVGAGSARIDLLVSGQAEGRIYGAVIEIKIDHHLHNPLGAYARVAKSIGLATQRPGVAMPTGALVVLGRSASPTTRARLARNRGWRFVHWAGFLRRFERELAALEPESDFDNFRRLLWERFS